MTTNPYDSPTVLSQGPTGALHTTPEGWLQYHSQRTKEDWIALMQHFALEGPYAGSVRFRRHFQLVFFAALGLVLGFMMQQILIMVLLSATIGVLIWLRYPSLIRGNMRRTAEKLASAGRNLTTLGENWITLTPQSFQVRTLYSFSSTDWEAIEKVEVTRGYMFVFLSSNTAIPIRLADFPDEASRQKFIQTAIDYFRSGRSKEVLTPVVM